MNTTRKFSKVIKTLGLMGLMMAVAGLLATQARPASATSMSTTSGKVAVWAMFNPTPSFIIPASVAVRDSKGNVVAKGYTGSGSSSNTSYVVTLATGVYTVNVNAPGYSEYTEMIKVASSQTTTVKASLTSMVIPPMSGTTNPGTNPVPSRTPVTHSDPTPLAAQLGKLSVNVEFATSAINLVRATVVVTDSNGNTTAKGLTEEGKFLSELANGLYKVSITAPGFNEYTSEVTVGPEQTATINAYLVLIDQTYSPFIGR